MENKENVYGSTKDYNQESQEGIPFHPADPLSLDIEDEELVKVVDKRIKDGRNFYKSEDYDLYNRRATNEMYRFGRQIQQKERDRQLKKYESRYLDNVLYEIEATIKPLAMSRMPDLMVLPGNGSEEARLMAEEISKAVDTQIKQRENRRVLGLASQHLPVYFTGVIKVRWNPEIDDYQFESIHPDLIDVDHTCPTNNADDMQFVSQIVPLTVEEVVMRFPSAKEKFYEGLKADGLMVGEEPTWKELATTINIREVWFTWYKKKSNTEWERVEGVLWKYKHCILKKMKNPNYDYEGESRYFSYDEEGNKSELSEVEFGQILETGMLPENVQEERVYHNYFRRPRKPFYFFGYDQWGKQPYDETSRIEQNIQNQKSLDKRGKQIEETLNNRGHNVFSKEAGLTSADVEDLDMADPDTDLVVDGNVNDTHKYIPPERPGAEEFKDLSATRDRMYGVAGSSATRGDIQSDVATTNQIAREADYTRADDLVDETVNPAAQWMSEWALQMIKLRYTEDHFVELLGIAGKVVYTKLNRNMVDQGMIVKIKASGTDKLRAQNNAMNMAKMQMIDPYNFFKDMGLSDPEGRTELLILAKADPVAYLQKVVKNIDTSEALAMALMNANLPAPGMPGQPAQPPANPVMPGGQPGGTPPAGGPPIPGMQQPNTQAAAAPPPNPAMPAPGSVR
jgi:hypothetical protein